MLYLVRHAESEGNVKNVFGGDYPLSERGKDQVALLKAGFKDVNFDLVYSSPLLRAKQTAQILVEPLQMEVQIVNDLRERWYGNLEHELITDQIRELQTQTLEQEPSLLWDYQLTDDDETNRQLLNRFLPALHDIARTAESKNTLVVSHGNAIRTLLVHLGLGHFGQIRSGTFSNLAYVQLELDDDNLKIIHVHGLKMVD